MSADAHISSSRLRAPVNLSSSSNRTRARRINAYHDGQLSSLRGMLNLDYHASTSSNDPQRMWVDGRMQREVYYSSLAATDLGSGTNSGQRHNQDQHQTDALNNDLYEQGGEEIGAPSGSDNWLDMDRFEDWQKPTLDILCPDIHILEEEQLFPIAIAEDGETLPSELHPSHPYGDLHQPSLPYSNRFQVLRRPGGPDEAPNGKARKRKRQQDKAEEDNSEEEDDSGPDDNADSSQSNHFSIALNPPRWPFKRYGPGPGGPNSLMRNELRKPWRPYRAVWTELDLGSMG
ncbi:uncharacterized protein FA14DRAFT_153097 [Meira miltonrushii]|uniref:Uncharacterized protein n=1 Tax=Meira miltonrushii TaxID=1280837 RepID=A0A316VKY9_9BASI|nr:uncharacterized protein FA14DRAFT_153097 [Meira miltonrushii]PWN37738.1 hypothetical protein FA14DRAFT_153097 [Meira miltonrushii]